MFAPTDELNHCIVDHFDHKYIYIWSENIENDQEIAKAVYLCRQMHSLSGIMTFVSPIIIKGP